MSLSCSRGQLASAGGSGGAVHGRGCCGRPLAAVADLTAVLLGARGLAGSCERMRSGGAALQASKGRGATRRPKRTHVQNARSGCAQSTHETCSTVC